MGVYDFSVTDNKGNEVSLRDYEGKVLLIKARSEAAKAFPQNVL